MNVADWKPTRTICSCKEDSKPMYNVKQMMHILVAQGTWSHDYNEATGRATTLWWTCHAKKDIWEECLLRGGLLLKNNLLPCLCKRCLRGGVESKVIAEKTVLSTTKRKRDFGSFIGNMGYMKTLLHQKLYVVGKNRRVIIGGPNKSSNLERSQFRLKRTTFSYTHQLLKLKF